MLYIQPGSAWKILQLNLKIGNGCLGEQTIEVARLVNDGKKPLQIRTLETHATYMVNSCQGKVAGVIL